MREADALEALHAAEAPRAGVGPTSASSGKTRSPSVGIPTIGQAGPTTRIARALGLGGKDLYRQARAVWRVARTGDPRARSSVAQLDAGTKTIHAAYKDLRRRDRFSAGFRPTPYDVWPFRHDRAFGIPHPGSIPPAIVAHTLHYYTAPGALVVDPMAGGGTTLDVCESMGRRCLAYDLHPVRPEIRQHDVSDGFPPEARGCDLIFCDPPYHTMLARRYAADGVATAPLDRLDRLPRTDWRATAFATLRPGGYVALLLANQTEKDLPAGFGYLDHAFFGYQRPDRRRLPARAADQLPDGRRLPAAARPARPRRGPDARPGPRPARHAKAAGINELTTRVRRTPARRPCPGRRGWRGSGCGGRSARAVTRRPARTRSSSSSGRRLLDHQVDRRSSSAARRFLAAAARAATSIVRKLGLQLPSPALQPVGHLGEQVVAVLDPRADVAGAVLKLALALEIERVEEDLGDGLRVLLRGEPLGQLPGDSLIRQQFLQIDSNKEPPFGGETERCSRNRDAGRVFSRSWFSFGPSLGAARAEELGQRLERIWTSFRGVASKESGTSFAPSL